MVDSSGPHPHRTRLLAQSRRVLPAALSALRILPLLAALGMSAALAIPATLALFARAAHAQAAPIFLDGFFGDWTNPPELVDPAGDAGASGIDLRDVDLANDDDNLFVRFVVTSDLGLQEPNNLELYIDTDVNAATGRSIGGIGAELEWRFGDRRGTVYTSGGSGSTIFQDDVRLRQLPSVSSPEFEISIGRDVVPNEITLFPGGAVRVLFLDSGASGDRAPDAGGLMYSFDPTPVGAPTPIALDRDVSTDTRFVTWNSRDLATNTTFDPTASAAAGRVLAALDPEVICFQELYNVTSLQTAQLVEGFLPSGPGEAWYDAKQNDTIVVSRFPVLATWAIDQNVGVHLDANAALGVDVLLVNAHLPCCDNNSSRQAECDAIMQFFRDAMTAGGTVTVPNGTMLMLTGDLNLVGFSQQLTTLRTGDIVDNGTYGPDFTPDWDGTDLTDIVSRQTEVRNAYTWRNDSSSFAPGRLDFFIFSDSSADLAKSFIVYTPEMSAAALSQYGLLSNDVTNVSDHLPHVADFRTTSTDVREPGGVDPERVRVTAVAPAGTGSARLIVALDAAARLWIDVYDVRGARVRTIQRPDQGVFAAGEHTFEWDGRTQDGRRAANGTYLVRVATTSPARDEAGGARIRAVASSKILLLHR